MSVLNTGVSVCAVLVYDACFQQNPGPVCERRDLQPPPCPRTGRTPPRFHRLRPSFPVAFGSLTPGQASKQPHSGPLLPASDAFIAADTPTPSRRGLRCPPPGRSPPPQPCGGERAGPRPRQPGPAAPSGPPPQAGAGPGPLSPATGARTARCSTCRRWSWARRPSASGSA